jgi:hypothetical protein
VPCYRGGVDDDDDYAATTTTRTTPCCIFLRAFCPQSINRPRWNLYLRDRPYFHVRPSRTQKKSIRSSTRCGCHLSSPTALVITTVHHHGARTPVHRCALLAWSGKFADARAPEARSSPSILDPPCAARMLGGQPMQVHHHHRSRFLKDVISEGCVQMMLQIAFAKSRRIHAAAM